MRAGIIGCNWGLTYLSPLRAAGIEVAALCSPDEPQLAAIAAREGINRWHRQAAELADLELIIIATPAASHLSLLEQFRSQALICEKPLFGWHQPVSAASRLGRAPLWVNYAFAFLPPARQLAALLPQLGRIDRVEVHSQLLAPLAFDWPHWFTEVASHPLSLLLHLFGPAWPRGHGPITASRGTGPISGYQLQCWWPQGISGEIRVTAATRPGISHCLRCYGEQGVLQLQGEMSWGGPWRFAPLSYNGVALAQQPETGDHWLNANHSAVMQIVRAIRGDISAEAALASGLFDAPKALRLEALLAPS